MKEIEKLTKTELLILKSNIDKKLENIEKDYIDDIKRKDSVKNKTKISQLTPNDRMFGIGYYKESGVHFMDYCDVKGYTDTNEKYPDYVNISVSKGCLNK